MKKKNGNILFKVLDILLTKHGEWTNWILAVKATNEKIKAQIIRMLFLPSVRDKSLKKKDSIYSVKVLFLFQFKAFHL